MSRVKGYRQLMQAIIVSICLLVVVAACQNGVAQIANKNTLSLQNEAIATPSSTATAVTGQGMGILVPQQHGKTPVTTTKGKISATPTAQGGTGTASGSGTATPNPGSGAGAPGAGTSNPVGVPAGFPNYFSFGVMSNPGEAPILDAMRSQNGTAYAFRYQYLTGGVNTGHGWETWNQPAGQYATNYMNESYQNGYIPAFAYYEICLSNGVNPGSYCGGHNLQQDTSNIDNPSTMNAYYANWALLMQRIGAFGHPVLVIVEPDFWGFMQNATNGSDNAADVPASVNSSGYPDAAGFPDTVQGFAWALLHMRDKYAPNAILALHASCWASGNDIATSTSPNLNVTAMVQQEAAFLNSAGLVGNPAGVSSWDVLSNDVADFDSGQPGSRGWWDRYNKTFPNFARYLSFISQLSQATNRRVVMWQVPMGNQYFDTMNNSPGHYQDNRAEYILGHVQDFANAGVIAVLFGPGNGGTMNTDAMHDGVTNPAPISTYECNMCNNHVSSYPDDDGGYLRIFVGQYMQNPLPLS
jgi:hypothetical protein